MWIEEVSFWLNCDNPDNLSDALRETLEFRVGSPIFEILSSSDQTDFARPVSSEDEEVALAWLESKVPRHRGIVQEEFDGLVGEVSARISLNSTLGISERESDVGLYIRSDSVRNRVRELVK